MKTLYMMIGPPGAGKTFWRENFIAENPEVECLSPDNLRKILLGDESNVSCEGYIWEQVDKKFEENIEDGVSFIFDGTFVQRKRRAKYIDYAKECGYNTVAVDCFTGISKEECLKRNAARARVVPEFVIERMAAQYQPVNMDEENFDQIITANQK